MNSKIHSYRALCIALFLVALVLILPDAGWAQQLFNTTTASNNLKATIKPLVQFFQWVIGGACLLVGMWEAFKASRGNSKGWINALLLWAVGAFVFAPSTILNALGFNSLASRIQDIGL